MALDHHLRDLFSFKPDLVLYDITSTYFEGAGPADFAKHGHSRDGKPHNVQVIVAVVMVAGWPIAHYVWAGNEVDHTTVGKAIADLHQRFGFNRLVLSAIEVWSLVIISMRSPRGITAIWWA